jgi:hypothetical protein
MAAMSVAPISRHTRSFGARCYSTDVEVADTFCFKMITRVYEVKRINMILLSPREIGLSFSPHIPDFQVVKKCLDLEKIQARLESRHSDDQERSHRQRVDRCEMLVQP